ncbi:hypothetical protein N9L83_01555 [Flavobacteriales bacterium]|jgi:hypothetical protein|nr:hypothetical protein [Flavobacteriales bacterium]
MARYLLIIVCLCSQFETTAQRDLPITLSTETSTTYYTDGSSRSNSRMFFQLVGGAEQRMGFLGRRMGRHLSEAEPVQKEFKSFQTVGAISQALALATSATLIVAIFSDGVDEITGEEVGWFQVYQWPIYCGVGYLASGYLASNKLTKTVELHNGLIGDATQPAYLDFQPIALNPSAIGPGLRIRF